MDERIKELVKLVNYNRFITKDLDAEWTAVSELSKIQKPVRCNAVGKEIDESTCYYLACEFYPDENKVFSLSISEDIAEFDENGIINVKDMSKLKKLLSI